MGNIELKITRYDWLSVLVIGTSFSTLLSLFGYYLLGLPPINGAWFGLALGFFITIFSLAFISFMNHYLLPNIDKKFWNTTAAFFSFLAGFLGTLTTYYTLQYSEISIIELFSIHPFQSASIIGLLTYLMGALIYRFVKTRNEKEHIDTLFIQSRVRSLETQLNPHFLYNALNSLAELIHQDPLRAEAAVIKISTFLRNTMIEAPLITLEQEIRNASDYIELENIRFNGHIQLSIEVDDAIKNSLVPKFSIQLLCENAIKHSMINSIQPFNITIHAFKENGIRINVSNNGKEVTSTAFGIGLSNLQERLSHLCEGKVTIGHLSPPTYTIMLKELYEFSDRR
ncbi:MAG TPA: histidine kinase [Sulfuricurvum sp.]|nr:MAG: sensor histidine kinase [Campylobacterales bacterium 16-40-21]OZA03074.1 MAG: sensor histidine kinase [Sulfuricurvum sp. 17-40-25]HQS66840.1 histidine kinase [Sulfuricurvum sp.]HQT37120.1 histidine kinase [Sulfuricurvum sp.]